MALATRHPPLFVEATFASAEMLGLDMVRDDPHGWRLDVAAQSAAVRDALAIGKATAKSLQMRFGNMGPQRIAYELGVPVDTTDDDPMVVTLWRFAEYRPRPPRICVYSQGIAIIDRALVEAGATHLSGGATIHDVFVAHELYHHLEAAGAAPKLARRYRPALFRIGPWHWRTGIAALSEIAAGAFAQSLLGLPCHPRVFDLLAADALSAKGRSGKAKHGGSSLSEPLSP